MQSFMESFATITPVQTNLSLRDSCTAGTFLGHEGRFPTLMGDYLDPVHALGTGHHAVQESTGVLSSLVPVSGFSDHPIPTKCDGLLPT
jgi:hypothetical protein